MTDSKKNPSFVTPLCGTRAPKHVLFRVVSVANVRLFLLFFADFLRVFVESVVPDGKRRRETRGDRRLGVARGPRDAPRSLYVGLAPTPGKMILFMGSYCFHSCPAHDIPPAFSLSPDGDPGRGGARLARRRGRRPPAEVRGRGAVGPTRAAARARGPLNGRTSASGEGGTAIRRGDTRCDHRTSLE